MCMGRCLRAVPNIAHAVEMEDIPEYYMYYQVCGILAAGGLATGVRKGNNEHKRALAKFTTCIYSN